MSEPQHERRATDYALERRIDGLDMKIDKVDARVEAASRETKSAIEMLVQVLEERAKASEQRWDMAGRQHQQAIDLLTSTVVKLEQNVSATQTQSDITEREVALIGARLEEQKKQADLEHKNILDKIGVSKDDLEATKENLRWISRLAVATALSMLGGVLVFVITHS